MKPIALHEWGHCIVLAEQYEQNIEVYYDGSKYTCVYPEHDGSNVGHLTTEHLQGIYQITGDRSIFNNKIQSGIAGAAAERLAQGTRATLLNAFFQLDNDRFWTDAAVYDKEEFLAVVDGTEYPDVFDTITTIDDAMKADGFDKVIADFERSLSGLKVGESFIYERV